MKNNSPENSNNLFNKEYFSGTYGVDGLSHMSQHWWSVRMYASITRRWLRITGGRQVLEIGCGHGFILGMLEKDYTTYGVDISPYAIDQAAVFAPLSTCHVGDIETGLPAPLRDKRVDLILARYVLEHVRHPQKVVQTIATHLRPGGLFFFSVPNTGSMGARWKGDAWYARKDPTHISLLPPQRWRDITRKSGFHILKEFSDGYWDIPYLPRVPMWMQYILFLGPTALACLLGREILPKGFGENVMIIARKSDSGDEG